MRTFGLWEIYFANGLWVVLEWFLSYREGMFSPAQVRANWGVPGIASALHGGLWWNLLALPIAAKLVLDSAPAAGWTTSQWLVALTIGFAIAAGNHANLIINQRIPDPLGWQQVWVSWPIALHGVYMTVYGVLGVLFVLYSGKVDPGAAILIGFVFAMDFVCGMHVPLGLADLVGNWVDVPKNFLRPDVYVALAILWIVVSGCVWFATKTFGAGVALAGLGAAIGCIVAALKVGLPVVRKIWLSD